MHSARSATGGKPQITITVQVSIHALLTECDHQPFQGVQRFPGFNPRTPYGVRQEGKTDTRGKSLFQSTHSLRSATWVPAFLDEFQRVSIHALLTECDRTEGGRKGVAAGFNPRTPYGVRLTQRGAIVAGYKFQSTHSLRSATFRAIFSIPKSIVSIHALLTECDHKRCMRKTERPVSIHALLTECDLKIFTKCLASICFNPRTPYGVRPRSTLISSSTRWFQSTHSLRSATSLYFHF